MSEERERLWREMGGSVEKANGVTVFSKADEVWANTKRMWALLEQRESHAPCKRRLLHKPHFTSDGWQCPDCGWVC